MNRDLLNRLVNEKTEIFTENLKAVAVGYSDDDIIRLSLDSDCNNLLPKLYERHVWKISQDEIYYEFNGEIEERYMSSNMYILNVKILDGIKCKRKHKLVSCSNETEAILIGAASEKFIVTILKLDANHAIIESKTELPKDAKMWLRYKELAIASFPSLEHNEEESYIYYLDFSIETIEKRGWIAEMILKGKM